MAGPFVTPALASAILSARILVVGSGGIGCELLKNLSLSGFVKVEVIDLDTIDVSNLNRQFLFRQHHVGQPKCVVACEAARNMSRYGASGPPPEASSASKASEDSVGFFLAHHGNVKDNTRFGVKFFKRFDVVLNALDNVDARRHVNRLCIAAELQCQPVGGHARFGRGDLDHVGSDSSILRSCMVKQCCERARARCKHCGGTGHHTSPRTRAKDRQCH